MGQTDLQTRFEPLFREIEAITDALAQARSTAELGRTIERCRDALLRLAEAARQLLDGSEAGEAPDDIDGWIDALDQSDETHAPARLLRSTINQAWQFATRDDVLAGTRRADAEAAVLAVDCAIGLSYVTLKRRLSPMPEHCPNCNSPHLMTTNGTHRPYQPPFGVTSCLDCGWSGS